jgi:hypothetical protein
MLRKVLVASLLAGTLGLSGCGWCCNSPWFSWWNRRCCNPCSTPCASPCNSPAPVAGPVVAAPPPGALMQPPPPDAVRFGPSPDAVAKPGYR